MSGVQHLLAWHCDIFLELQDIEIIPEPFGAEPYVNILRRPLAVLWANLCWLQAFHLPLFMYIFIWLIISHMLKM